MSSIFPMTTHDIELFDGPFDGASISVEVEFDVLSLVGGRVILSPNEDQDGPRYQYAIMVRPIKYGPTRVVAWYVD